jgi:hypothetical protein
MALCPAYFRQVRRTHIAGALIGSTNKTKTNTQIADCQLKSLDCLFVCLEKRQTDQTKILVNICKSAVWLNIPNKAKQAVTCKIIDYQLFARILRV